MGFIRDIEPPVVPKSFHQLGVLVLDGSGSMAGTVDSKDGLSVSKAAAVNMAVRDLFSRFKASNKSANFTFCAVSFTHEAAIMLPPTAVADIDDNGNYDPVAHAGGGGTFLGAGIGAAREICDQFFAAADPGLPASAVVLLMSDGECAAPAESQQLATELKTDDRVTLATTFFATKGQSSGGQNLLRAICSDPTMFYKTVYDAETLRAFFMASMSVAATRAFGELMPAQE